MSLGWYGTRQNETMSWTCGYCGKDVGGNVGYDREGDAPHDKIIYICPRCQRPTVFLTERGPVEQIPGPVRGHEVQSLPETVESLYAEVRSCIQYHSYTSAVLSMRKLLMHVAVEQGAATGLTFARYVDYLAEEGVMPRVARDWVDAIRKAGNEAAHEIVPMDESRASQLFEFTEMLLKLVYEFPAKLKP